MRAGTLRRIGMLQRPETSRDPSGGPVLSWLDVGRVRFMIQLTQGREIEAAGNVRSIATWTVTMRFRPGVMAGMRIRADEPLAPGGERYYRITAVNDVYQLHHELELTVVEGLSSTP